MPDFNLLSENVNDDTLKTVFKIIGGRQHASGAVADSVTPIHCTVDDTVEIQALMLDKIRTGLVLDGGYQTVDEAKLSSARMVADSFFNPMNGIGTGQDPAFYNQATVPVSMSPNEATALYASGGIPARIIDTKSQGMMINGYRFISDKLNPTSLERLKNYADSKAFDRVLQEATRDGLTFGGSLMVPHFKRDNNCTYAMSVPELIKSGTLKKDSLERFWQADRWNCVLIPDYDISAADYLAPANIFVPITGLTVNTTRSALIRPKQLPYWGTIRQMGWGVSDMEAWVRSLLGYEMCIASIPIMAQQSSILFRHIPMDGIIAQNGPEYAAKFAKDMANQMVQMSNVAPKTFNSVGELKAIERNFTGYPELVQLLKQDIGAKAEMSDSIIFNTQATGFSSNTEDTTLKQAEAIQKIANKVIYQVQPLVEILVLSCFGPDSEEAKYADQVRLDFDSPTVLTNAERNQAGATFSAVFTAMIGGGLQPADAIEIGKAFVPDVEIPQDVIDRLNAVPDMSETSPAIADLGERIRGISEGALAQFGERLRGESGVRNLHQKLASQEPSLLQKIANPLTRLFGRTQDSGFNESDHPRASNGQFGEGGSTSKKPTLNKKGKEYKSKIESIGTAPYKKSGSGKSATIGDLSIHEFGDSTLVKTPDGNIIINSLMPKNEADARQMLVSKYQELLYAEEIKSEKKR